MQLEIPMLCSAKNPRSDRDTVDTAVDQTHQMYAVAISHPMVLMKRSHLISYMVQSLYEADSHQGKDKVSATVRECKRVSIESWAEEIKFKLTNGPRERHRDGGVEPPAEATLR